MSEACRACGRALTGDEIAVTKKLINRGARSFLCVDCLARHFEVRPADIRERIAYFRRTGCTLFAGDGEEPDMEAAASAPGRERP